MSQLKDDIKFYLKTYSENLAFSLLEQGHLTLTFDEKATLNPTLLQPKNSEQTSLYERDFPQPPTLSDIEHIRSGCLLKTGESYFSFFHKSLMEYFVAKALYHGVMMAVQHHGPDSKKILTDQAFTLNQQPLNDEPEILQMLAEITQHDKVFKRCLLEILELLKKEPDIWQAAANAFNILKYARYNFSRKDLHGIGIKLEVDLTLEPSINKLSELNAAIENISLKEQVVIPLHQFPAQPNSFSLQNPEGSHQQLVQETKNESSYHHSDSEPAFPALLFSGQTLLKENLQLLVPQKNSPVSSRLSQSVLNISSPETKRSFENLSFETECYERPAT